MLASYLLSLREGIEAALIVGILLGAVRQMKRADLVPTIWFRNRWGWGYDVPKPGMRKAVVASLRAVFDAPDRPEAERQLEIAVKKYRTTAPKLAEWLEANIPEGLAVFALPASPAAAADDQRAGAAEQGAEAADEGGRTVPQRGVGPATRQRRGDGDQRGVGDEPQVPLDGAGLTRRQAGNLQKRGCTTLKPTRFRLILVDPGPPISTAITMIFVETKNPGTIVGTIARGTDDSEGYQRPVAA
jgi:hypothetical protein